MGVAAIRRVQQALPGLESSVASLSERKKRCYLMGVLETIDTSVKRIRGAARAGESVAYAERLQEISADCLEAASIVESIEGEKAEEPPRKSATS